MKAERGSKKLARREFLRISSQAVILTAAGTLISPKSVFAAAAGAAFDPLLSIGFAPSVPADGASVPLGSADGVLTPDPAFISRGARVTILGSGRAPGHKNAPGTLFLDALFPSKSGAENENRRFRFWSMTGRDDHDVFSGNVSFAMPVLATTGLAFMARYRRPNVSSPSDPTVLPPIEEDNAAFTLSLGRAAGPNLRAGVYVVALREPGDGGGVSWDRLRVTNNGGSFAIDGASFAYVILEVGYGDGKPVTRRRAV